jgi:hypothetical protein
LPRAPAPKSQTPTLVAALLGDLGFSAPPEDQDERWPRRENLGSDALGSAIPHGECLRTADGVLCGRATGPSTSG